MLKSRFVKDYHILFLLLLIPGFLIRLFPLKLGNLEGFLTGLDPYLFLRWANWIEKYGYLPENDYYKYFPLGYDVRKEMWLLSFFIYFLGRFFNSNYIAAVFYSPLMFLLGSFFLCLFLKEILGIKPKEKKEYYIYIILAAVLLISISTNFFKGKELQNFVLASSLILFIISSILYPEFLPIIAFIATISFIPSFIFRLSSGFSDKEGLAYFFFSLSVYFMAKYFKRKDVSFAFYSGLFLGLMALSWGGYQFLLASISLASILCIKSKDTRRFVIFLSIPFLYCVLFLTRRYGGLSFLYSSYYGIIFSFSLVISILIEILEKLNIRFEKKIFFIKLDEKDILVFSLALIGLLLNINRIFGIINFVFITPYGGNRFALSVAENQPPYFSSWVSSLSTPFLLLLLLLPIAVYYFTKDIRITTLYYVSYLLLIFSRYSSEFEFLSGFYWIPLSISILLPYFKKEKKFEEMFLLVLLTFATIGSRTAIRVFFVLSIPLALIISYSIQKLSEIVAKESYLVKLAIYFIFFLVLIPSIKSSVVYAMNIYPTLSAFWTETFYWVKNNTSPYDIISHWWDYGYWTHFYSERFTSVDGGNSYYIRNFYNARYFFCGRNPKEVLKALEVLGYPDYILITSREPFVFYQIARIAYEDTWLGVFQPTVRNNTVIFFARSPGPIHKDILTKDFIFPANRSYVVGLIPQNNTWKAIVMFSGKYELFNVCECGKECESPLDGCIVIKKNFVFYVPKKILNTTFVRSYVMEEEIPWLKLVYDNEIKIIDQFGKVYRLRELRIENLLNERIPDLKVYKVDYWELRKAISSSEETRI